jgi:hypothetical protein
MLFFKLDYVLELEHARQRDAAQCSAYVTRAARPESGGRAHKLRQLAKRLALMYLTHQGWQAHDGVFMSVPFESEHATGARITPHAKDRKRALRKLAGVRLSAAEASAIWPRVLEHKWLLSERLGRDVGLRMAAVDYVENVRNGYLFNHPLRRESWWLKRRGARVRTLALRLSFL